MSQPTATQRAYCVSLYFLTCKKCCNVGHFPCGWIKHIWFWLYCCTCSNIYRLANDLALYARLTGLLYSAYLSLLTSLVINGYAHRLKMAIYKVRYFSPNSPPWMIIDHGSVFENCLSEWTLVLIQWYLPLLSTEPFPSNRRWKARGNRPGGSVKTV